MQADIAKGGDGRENILIADDDLELAPRVESALADRGYNVFITPELVRAKAQLRRWELEGPEHRDYAVVIIDMDFPDGDAHASGRPNDLGMEIFREALQNPFLEPVIATAFPKLETAIRAANQGSFRYLVKDEHFIGRLVYVVEAAVETRRALLRMYGKLIELRKIHGDLLAGGASGRLIDDAQDSVRVIEQGFVSMLKSRGKEPPPALHR